MKQISKGRQFQNMLAFFLSVVFSPFFCAPYFCYVFAQATARSHDEIIILTIITTWFSIGVPAVFIAWQVSQGKITDLHVSRREQRQGPFVAGMLAMALQTLCLWGMGGPERLVHLSAILWLQSGLFSMISSRWKVSMHTSVLAACLAACIELAGWSSNCLYILIPLSWARHHRGRHSWGQAWAGATLGYALTFYPLRWLATL